MALPNRFVTGLLVFAISLVALDWPSRAQQSPQTQAPAPVIQAPPQGQTAAPAAATSANRLLTGKLIYVAPMPNNLDTWLQEDLKNWGRYRVTSNPEGVDLEISANVPERQTRYRERNGIPLPKGSPRKQMPETSIDVLDWVNGGRLWTATLLNKNPKANEAPPAPAASIEIAARDMTPDQLALKITRELQRYVEQLESSGAH